MPAAPSRPRRCARATPSRSRPRSPTPTPLGESDDGADEAAAGEGDEVDVPTEAPTPQPSPTPTPSPEPSALSEPGPFAVGVTTMELADRPVEVWYPADADSVAGAQTEIFDALSTFPEEFQALIPPELGGEVDTGAYRDAEPATGDDRWPVIIYSHGFGGYRQVATFYTTHLASHGFVVASTDHLERGLAEQTRDTLGAGQFDETNTEPDFDVQDVAATLALLGEGNEVLDPSRIDLDNVAITGHSAGAGTAIRAAVALDEIDTFISISGGSDDETTDKPGLVVIGERDIVVTPDRSEELYDLLTGPKVLVNIADAGHNSFTDACPGIRDLGGLSSLVDLLGEAQVARADDGCTEDFVAPEPVFDVLQQITLAHVYEVFGNGDPGDALTRASIELITPLADYRSDAG